jgi:hypothetical protein
MIGYFWAARIRVSAAIIKDGGVGERLKPAVLKNKIAVLLSGRKFN